MLFDPENHIVQLCAQGMTLEGEGKPQQALQLFEQAWTEATNDFERFTAAHYIARHQPTIADKLKWDETALQHALCVPTDMSGTYPSLYLNIGKCHEELNNKAAARASYQLAMSYADKLPDDGYGNMIHTGIAKGLERVKE